MTDATRWTIGCLAALFTAIAWTLAALPHTTGRHLASLLCLLPANLLALALVLSWRRAGKPRAIMLCYLAMVVADVPVRGWHI